MSCLISISTVYAQKVMLMFLASQQKLNEIHHKKKVYSLVSQCMTKPTQQNDVRPAKTQIRLAGCPGYTGDSVDFVMLRLIYVALGSL